MTRNCCTAAPPCTTILSPPTLRLAISRMQQRRLRKASTFSASLRPDQGNAQAQRDVAIGLEKLGDVKLQEGDQAGALAAYQESLESPASSRRRTKATRMRSATWR